MGRDGHPQGGLCPPLATPHVRNNAHGVYFIFKNMDGGSTFRISVPKYPAKDPNYRITANQRSRRQHPNWRLDDT
jgi:hypothetical protein